MRANHRSAQKGRAHCEAGRGLIALVSGEAISVGLKAINKGVVVVRSSRTGSAYVPDDSVYAGMLGDNPSFRRIAR
ncbi:hypothetical protein BCAR13_790004 [Paraburkholderia caribensis]|nr:hypothetical protein BCAR13_790004 [Paraburkholderia caribensis]